jgi:hypothetical protein
LLPVQQLPFALIISAACPANSVRPNRAGIAVPVVTDMQCIDRPERHGVVNFVQRCDEPNVNPEMGLEEN